MLRDFKTEVTSRFPARFDVVRPNTSASLATWTKVLMKIRARVTLMMSSMKIRARLLFRGCTVVVASHKTNDQFFYGAVSVASLPKRI